MVGNMGQEVNKTSFSQDEFFQFKQNLDAETNLLKEMLEQGSFIDQAVVTGFELEGWLIDHNYFPAPINQEFLGALADPLVVSELSRFNIELNGTPQPLKESALGLLQEELGHTYLKCCQVANSMGASLLFIGTLPTLRNSDLSLANMTPMKRYQALNELVSKSRNYKPVVLDIDGLDHLHVTHDDVMLEAGTTSFQVHLQVPIDKFVRHFNASLILSAPIIAATANSPYLFGKNLWAETRIPLFEQAITSKDFNGMPRVSFGEGYARSPLDSFLINQTSQPVLLPFVFESDPEKLNHLRLHNGTVWRWNRPLIGFNNNGVPHVRIEHRIMPAGPSIPDMIANAALYLGACTALASDEVAAETKIDFEQARNNFYLSAKHGLDAEIRWLDGHVHKVRDILLNQVIDLAAKGLASLGIRKDECDYYMSILSARVESGQTGAGWQRAFIKQNGANYFNLTANYLHRQQSGKPVHEWEI